MVLSHFSLFIIKKPQETIRVVPWENNLFFQFPVQVGNDQLSETPGRNRVDVAAQTEGILIKQPFFTCCLNSLVNKDPVPVSEHQINNQLLIAGVLLHLVPLPKNPVLSEQVPKDMICTSLKALKTNIVCL